MTKAQASIFALIPFFVLTAFSLTKLMISLEEDTEKTEKTRNARFVLLISALLIIFSVICEELMERSQNHYGFISAWKEEVLKIVNLVIIGVLDLGMSIVVESVLKHHNLLARDMALGTASFTFLGLFTVALPLLDFLKPRTRFFGRRRRQRLRNKLLRVKPFTASEHFMTQIEMNKLFEKEEYPIAEYYNNLPHTAFVLAVYYFLCRASILFGLVNFFATDVIERVDNQRSYKDPSPSARYLAERIRYHTSFQVIRVFTFARMAHFYWNWREKDDPWRFFWPDLVLFLLYFFRFSIFLDKMFVFGKKGKICREDLERNLGVSGGFGGDISINGGDFDEFEGSGDDRLEFRVEEEGYEEGLDLRRKVVSEIRFEQLERFFETDYDRVNPLTSEEAKEEWMRLVKSHSGLFQPENED